MEEIKQTKSSYHLINMADVIPKKVMQMLV